MSEPKFVVTLNQSKPVEVDPDSVLTDYGVFHADDGDHFSGVRAIDGKGRISTPIVEWDPESRVGTTQSGRRYQLSGEPDGGHVPAGLWRIWCAAHGVPEHATEDVTDKYILGPAPSLN